jgi:hypothetical protein
MAEEKKIDEEVLKETTSSKPIFVWKSRDNIQFERSSLWYLVVCAIAGLLIFLLYLIQQWMGIALVAVATVIFIIMSRIKPREVDCAVFEKGVVVDGKAYQYSEFKSFWVNQAEVPKIKLQKIGKIAGQVDLPLLNIDQEEVRLFLSKHLPEEEDKGEDLTDTVNRLMRF